MTRRLLAGYLTITVIVLVLLMVPLGVFYSQRERERLAADVEHDANVIATLYEDDLEAGTALDPTPADTYEDRTGARVVVVDSAGISQVDTGADVNRDFSTRPEFEAALEGVRTSGTRRSETLGTDLLYVAVPVASGGTVHGALRITLDTADVNQRIRNFWLALGAMAAVVLAAVVLIGWVIARSVTRPLRELTASAERFASGDLSVGDHVAQGPPEIRALDTTMTTMAQRLDGVLTDQRRFVADASHQLRTPLTALRLRLENLQSDLEAVGGDPDGHAVDALERAIGETERLTELVSNLLQLARADARPVTEVVDLVALVRGSRRHVDGDRRRARCRAAPRSSRRSDAGALRCGRDRADPRQPARQRAGRLARRSTHRRRDRHRWRVDPGRIRAAARRRPRTGTRRRSEGRCDAAVLAR